MKNKFARAAVIGGISTVLSVFLSVLLNSFIMQYLFEIGYGERIQYVVLLLCVIETFIAMFVGIIIYSKFFAKRRINIVKGLGISLLAGVVKEGVLFIIPLSIDILIYNILTYVISFVVLSVFALMITFATATETSDEEKEIRNKTQKQIVANEEMSAKAQYAYNEKLSAIKETAITVDEVVEAKLFAQAVELQLLKSTLSAKFCSLEEMTVATDNGKYIVSGFVDSQNSYGAMVRTPFKITVFKDEGVWKNADRFVSMSASIGAKVFSHTLIYWIIGIILSLVSFAVFYFIISAQLGF